MPSMYEIYEKYAAEYDQLVDAEDYQGNLARHLLQLTDWNRKVVLEAGAGTGRVTQMYAEQAASIICLDRSQHMLSAAARRLSKYASKITFGAVDNTALSQFSARADVFIEGWSWGHSIVDDWRPVEVIAQILLSAARRNVFENGVLILIETMGTNTPVPAVPHARLEEFYALLEAKYSFHQSILRTDYWFPCADEAARIMGFFFGDTMQQDLLRSRATVIPEWTGVWCATNSQVGPIAKS
jgi:SAM-dependent methyltransferase